VTERRSIEVHAEVPGTPEQVWEAIATGPGITAWFVPAQVDEREGGAVAFDFGAGLESTGVITGWEPPHRLAYDEQWPVEGRDHATLATEFLVEARAGGTCVVRAVSTFSTTGFDDELDSMADGWAAMLDNLRVYMTHFAGQAPSTVSASSPTDKTKEEAWASMIAALGLDGARPGERVATDVDAGAPALAGVVERRRDDDLLVRTDDALANLAAYTWEGRTITTIRAARFGPGAEQAAARDTEAWREWLTARA
jgi:uncharacterized protein YndB with AHSA1/START domain